jgi:hypothetical protein
MAKNILSLDLYLQKELKVEGMIKVSYTVMCKNDVSKELSLAEVFANEKVEKAIKSEFAKGLRNLVLSHKEDAEVFLKTEKEVFQMTVSKNDFADLLELAEEDARKHKRIKKECDGVELVDILTVD